MPSVGFLIYSGVMPLVKMFLSIFFGFIITRKGLFPPAASRGASQVTMNISLPCLIFSSIVPAFNSDNISALGPLFLLAFIYMTIGYVSGLVIRELFYVPRNFWQGIIILVAMSNWGNLPNAVIISVTQQSPFDPKTDPALGVSFVSIFIVASNIVFWGFGAAHSLSWDYLPGVPQGEDAEKHLKWDEKPLGGLFARHILGSKQKVKLDLPATVSTEKDCRAIPTEGAPMNYPEEAGGNADPDAILARQTSKNSFRSRRPSGSQSFRPPGMFASTSQPPLPTHIEPPPVDPYRPSPTQISPPSIALNSRSSLTVSSNDQRTRSTSRMSLLSRVFRPVLAIVNPVMISMVVSLPVSLVQPLKALFVDATSTGGPAFKAPDGRPPLAFIYDTATFLGNIAVPLALILLGVAFARLKVPRPLSRLPIAAMLAACGFKLFILPVIGVVLVQAMVKRGLIPQEAKAEKFVGMFLSGTPAAVNQLIVASLYAPDGETDTTSAFLLVQYILMFFSSSILTAVALLLA